MNVGVEIKRNRKNKGLSQKALGDLAGIADSTIRRYELGTLNPKYETLQKIAEALEISIDAFMNCDSKIKDIDALSQTRERNTWRILAEE